MMSRYRLGMAVFFLLLSFHAGAWRFAVTGDSRGSDHGVNRVVLVQLAKALSNASIQLVLFTGDLVDGSGDDFNKNLEVSQKRADSVVQYLAVMHNIPLRRIETPMGYGSTKQVADDKTKAGQAQNRRVEVRVLVNKGLANTSATPAAK